MIDVNVEGGGALHLVQTVDVEVVKTVESVLVVSKLVLPPVVCVKVTGQVVTVEITISVVITSVGLVAGAGGVLWNVLVEMGGDETGGEDCGTTELEGGAGGEDCGPTEVEEGGVGGEDCWPTEAEEGGAGGEEAGGAPPPSHLVQNVVVDVEKTVEIVDVTCVIVLEPEVVVKVTGHVVRVDTTISVVMISDVLGEGAREDVGNTEVGVVLDRTVVTLLVTGIV